MPTWDVKFTLAVNADHPDIIRCIERSHGIAQTVSDIPIVPAVNKMISELNILRAVRGTTGLEGSELSEQEVQEVLGTPSNKRVLPPSRQREEQEVRNARDLMLYVAQLVEDNPDLPLTEDVVCKIHEIITRDIDYDGNIPGKYRNHPVRAGTYIPPRTGTEIRSQMKEFIRWFNEDAPTIWDPIIRAIVAHFYVVSIHPFGDGNGRTARGVESLLLYQGKVNVRGFYSLANYYYQHRGEYERFLDHVRFESGGDLTPFIHFAVRGLMEELQWIRDVIIAQVQIVSFRDYARNALDDKLGSTAGQRMLSFLYELTPEPVSMADIRDGKHLLSRYYNKLSSRTFYRDIDLLRSRRLILLEDEQLCANLDIMEQFIPPFELMPAKPVAKRKRRSRR